MVNDVTNAFSAYQAAVSRQVVPSAEQEVQDVQASSPAGTFTSMVKSAVEQAEKDNQDAEVMTMKALKGTADMQDVVLAISNAEVALQTVVAVRDKVVTAYQEIMQMPM